MRVSSMLVTAAALLLAGQGLAAAKPSYKTKYTYYTISGDTAEEIYGAMLRRGPKVNGAKAYAATSAVTTQDGRLRKTSSCRVENYSVNIDFEIKLPRIKNEKILPPGDRKRWRLFSSFLKTHEETHRKIWLGCAAELERKVKAVKARSCSDADKKAEALWDQIRTACSAKHNAFDAAEQKKLLKHPFVKLVFNRTSRSTRAAATQ